MELQQIQERINDLYCNLEDAGYAICDATIKL